MLCVATFVAPSRIHGTGLFAAEALPRGTLVWRFEPRIDRVLSEAELQVEVHTRGPHIREHVYLQEPGLWVLCGDDAVYMNHADVPNCDDPDAERTITRRDVAAGEELTVDYRSFDRSSMAWLPPKRGAVAS